MRNTSGDISRVQPTLSNITPISTYKEVLSTTAFANEDTIERNVVYGTRDDVHQFAADVDIVVFGVAKNVNACQIATYAERHGIKVLNCELITTWAEARSNTFKLTIKAHQTEKVLSNEIWPYGVGVRRFKNQKGSVPNKKSDVDKLSKERKSKPVTKYYLVQYGLSIPNCWTKSIFKL